jgi:hypothetical protein
MLAEIFMLKAEAAARAAKEASTSQFVPITLPAAASTQTPAPSIPANRTENVTGAKSRLD